MKSNQEILDEFGEKIVRKVFDRQYNFIKHNVSDLAEPEEFKNLFKGMTEIQKKEIENYTYQILSGALFEFLGLFEEDRKFKLLYDNQGKQVNLVEISEMLKSEPIIENGWIQRFSKELNKDNENLL